MTRWLDKLEHSPGLQQFAPHRQWSAAQKEEHVLFLHYRAPVDELRAIVPAPLELQIYDNSAWVAVIAFQMTGLRLRQMRLFGPFAHFSEIDFAALVSFEGRQGLYFISIEGAHRFTSFTTRALTGLPYLYSGADVRPDGDGFRARSGPRWVRGRAAASFDAHYSPSSTGVIPDPGSPIKMLTGQYSAFLLRHGAVQEMDEVHPPWKLLEADVDLRCNTIPDAAGVHVGPTPALVHYSVGRPVISWLAAPVGSGRVGLAPPERPGVEPL